MNRTKALGIGILVMLASGQAAAQDAKALRIQRDIAFARGLATDFGFVGLADEVLDDLLKIKDLDENSLNLIRLEKCNLRLLGARVRADIQMKRELFGQALAEIVQVVDRFRGQEMAAEARALYVQGALNFGSVLQALLADAGDPEARQKVLVEAEAIYKNAIKYANDVRAFYKPRIDSDTDARATYALNWMTQGELTKDWAAIATEADKAIRLAQAKQTITEFIFWIGEETVPGTRGLILLAQCYELEGKAEDAQNTYADVINNIWDQNLKNPDKEIPANSVPLLTRLMEEAYYQLIKIHTAAGNTDEAVAKGTEMVSRINETKIENRPVQHSFPQGMQALVEYARALWDSGEVDKAIGVASEVAGQYGTAVVGIEAKKLIRRILEDPAVAAKVNPEVLLQGADAAFREQSYEVCIRDAKKVLRALKDSKQQREFGLRTFDLIGKALTELGRHVEAAYAYGWGCEFFGDLGGGDPKYDELLSGIAGRCQNAVQRAFQQANKDPGLAPLVEYGRDALFKYAKGEADAILFRDAQALAQEGKHQDAIGKLRQISDKSDWHERAKSQIGKVLFDSGDLSGAEREMKAFLEALGRARVESLETKAGQNRLIAKALAVFTLGEIAWKRATGAGEGGAMDMAQLDEMVRIFTPFPEEFESQTDMVTFAHFYLGRAWTAKGDLAKAREYYRNLKEIKKRSTLIPNLALAIYIGYEGRVKALAADSRSTAEARAKAMREALHFVDEYLDGNPTPQYAAMFSAFTFALELKEEQRVLGIADAIKRIHGKERRDEIVRFVLPKVVEILQGMGEFNRAEPLVEEILNAYQKGRWPKSVLWIAVRTYAGWLELKDGQVFEVLGLNQPAKVLNEPYDLMSTLYKGVQSPISQFTLDYYRIVCQYTYVAYRAGITDSKYFDDARRYRSIAASINNFAGIKNALPILTDAERQEIEKLTPAQQQAREKELDREREELYQFFLYLSRKLGS